MPRREAKQPNDDPRAVEGHARWLANKQLTDRLRARDPAAVEEVIASGASLLGRTPVVVYAATCGLSELLRACLDRGDDPDMRHPKKGTTPLMLAAMSGELEAVRVLLAAGADPNAVNRHCSTPLMFACQATSGRDEIVDALLAAGAEADSSNFRRATPGALAEYYGDASLATKLRGLASAARQETMQEAEARVEFCKICNEKLRPKTQADYTAEKINLDPNGNVYVKELVASDAFRQMCNNPQQTFHRVLELRKFRKEASESWAVIKNLGTAMQQLRCEPRDVVVFDLCCGKSLTASLVGLMYPDSTVLAVDKLGKQFMPHFDDLPNVSFVQCDLFKAGELIERALESADGRPKVGIVLGMHLCGLLSEQAIHMFTQFESIKALVLSPCCLPGHRCSPIVEKARGLKVDYYNFWCLHLCMMLRHHPKLAHTVRCNLYHDGNILSEKDAMVTALRVPPPQEEDGGF